VPRLSELTPIVQRHVLEATKAGAQMVLNDANVSIARGTKSGRTYRRRGIEHQASAPGEPPATDTGALIASGRADAVVDGATVEAVVDYRAPYAVHLEYGTRKMLPRPFLNPAIERNRARIGALIARAIATATAQFARKR
jgi:hypothetical protein